MLLKHGTYRSLEVQRLSLLSDALFSSAESTEVFNLQRNTKATMLGQQPRPFSLDLDENATCRKTHRLGNGFSEKT